MRKLRVESHGASPEVRAIQLTEFETLVESFSRDTPLVIVLGDGEPDVLIVGICEDYAVATLMLDGRSYEFKGSDREGFREVNIGGQWSEHPEEFLTTRSKGIEVVKLGVDLPGLLALYDWVAS